MKKNIKDYFVDFDKLNARNSRANKLIESCGGELSGLSFYDVVSIAGSGVFTPQKRTAFLEDKMREMFSWSPVRASTEKGDYIDKDGNFFELKCSASNEGSQINVKQIRTWQDVSYYLVIYFDLDIPRNSKAYILSKEEMCNESMKRGSAAHGTKMANTHNGRVEINISLPVVNEWDDKYLQKGFFDE